MDYLIYTFLKDASNRCFDFIMRLPHYSDTNFIILSYLISRMNGSAKKGKSILNEKLK
jgi:hypothetical protein